jgi:polynucleotide 5'-hydroxyl-kinase GRC3/NOL9
MMAAAAAAGDASESSRPTEAASSPLRGAVQQVVAAAAHPAAEGSQGKAGSGDGAAAQQPRLVRLSRFRARNDNVEALGGERVRITLDAGESLCFCGSVSVRVESGALSVSGARLVPASGACDLHSPPWAPASLLELAPAGSATSKSASAPMRCVVTLAACAAKHLSAGPEVAEAAKVAAAEAPALCLAGFAPVFEAPTGVFAPLTVPDDWARALSDAAELRARSLVLVGPRGAGKSTLARLLVNRLLIRCTRVAMLDCDLGQSELAPPGLVGLAIIRRPLLGPPHTHSFWPDA